MENGLTRIQKATELSKGNLYLKHAILSLWGLNINNFTFSQGDKENEKFAYLSIPITDENLVFINLLYDVAKTMLKQMFHAELASVPSKTVDGSYVFTRFFNLSVPSTNKSYVNALFATVLGAHSEYSKQPSYQNATVTNSYDLMNNLGNNSIMLRVISECDKMTLGMTKIGREELLGQVVTDKTLGEYVDIFREKVAFRYGTFICDAESIEKLNRFIDDVVKGKLRKK